MQIHQSSSISALLKNPFLGDVSVAQLVASVSGVVLGGVAMVVGSNLASNFPIILLLLFILLFQFCPAPMQSLKREK